MSKTFDMNRNPLSYSIVTNANQIVFIEFASSVIFTQNVTMGFWVYKIKLK